MWKTFGLLFIPPSGHTAIGHLLVGLSPVSDLTPQFALTNWMMN